MEKNITRSNQKKLVVLQGKHDQLAEMSIKKIQDLETKNEEQSIKIQQLETVTSEIPQSSIAYGWQECEWTDDKEEERQLTHEKIKQCSTNIINLNESIGDIKRSVNNFTQLEKSEK